MKTRNRVLAMFLAAVMLMTSVAWDFGEVKAETTEESTSAIAATDDGVSINFDNIDVAELDANGYTSTRFVDGAVVKGEINRAVSEHWFSGEGDDTPYGSGEGETATGKNIGLKSRDIQANNTRSFMYTPYTYEDFQVSAEIYYGAYTGIVFGEKNVYPAEGGEASSVALFFNGGRIHIIGAVERDSARIMRGTSAAIANNGSILGYKIFNNGSGDAIAKDAGGTYTVNVKKTGNHLLIWYSGGSGLMSIKLADSYKTGWVGIQSKCFDGDGGGFKSLNIEKVHAVEHHDLENVSLTDLDNMGYSYTFSSNKVLDKASAALKSENGILKGITTGSSMSSLNIPYLYENFRLEAEIYPHQAFGVAAGTIASVPLDGSGLACAYFNANQLEVRGAVQATGITASGGGTGTVSNATMFKLDSYDAAGDKYVRDVSKLVTVVVEVRGNTVTAWLEGYNGYVSMPTSTSYTTEKISLIGRSAGGFKSYTITNLDAGESADFDNVNLENLMRIGYKASDCADATLTDKAVSDVWFSGSDYSDTYVNTGLKPSDTDSSVDLLNLPKVYSNFRLETTMYHGQVVGVGIGKKGAKLSTTGGDNGGVAIYTNGNYIELTGSIDYSTANLTAGTGVVSKSCFYHYIPTGHTAAWNTEKTLVVEMQDGILTVWMEGYAGVLRIRVTDNYATENIALIARRYNTSGGNAGGGLKSYTIEKLPSTANPETTVDVAGYTEFNFIDTTKLDAAGFKVSQYKTDGTEGVEGQSISDYMYAGKIAASGKVAPNSSNNGLKGKTVTADGKMTILTAPYEYDNFRVSTEVYWGANTGIVIGEEGVYPQSTAKTSVRIYFNANQLQLGGAGFDYDTAKTTGGANKWNPHNLDSYGVGIFKPASDFTVTKGAVYKLNVELIDGMFTIWVDGCDGVLTVKATDEFWNVENKKIALTSRGYDGDCGGLKSLMVEELSDVIIPYTAEEFATYRSTDGHTAPTYKNYLFAGWYTEPTCSELENAVLSSATTVEEETVYAKFVVRDILTVKAQISEELLDNNLKNDGTGKIRFATTVDTPNYSQVGFKISYDKDGSGTPKEQVKANKTVYSTLNAIGDVTYQPTDFSKASTYFKACTVKNVGDSFYDLDFTVVPFWKTLDGTVVEGDAVVKTVNQGVNAEFLDGKTALFLGDSIQNGANEGVDSLADPYAWHERLPRYGMITQEVANKGAALTNTATSGRTQIVKQLDNEAVKDSYDFIILEGGVNDVLIDQDTQNPDITIDWGTINEDPNATFSDDNIAGAMQDLIVKTQEKFPNATIVYIINHYFRATATNMKNYVAMVKAACRVHGISYVDLSDTEAYPTLEPLTKGSAAYIPDSLHPNAAGYELSTPVIANHLRKLVTGELVDTVYVASTGTDAKGYGTESEPYATLNYAVSRVDDGGTIYVQNTLACKNPTGTSFSLGGYGFEDGGNMESAENVIDKVNYKQVTIAGDDDSAVLDFSVAGHLFLNESVILKDIQVKWPARINAEGNTFIVEESVKQAGDKEPMLIGGSHYNNLDKTDLRIYAGTYSRIVGGQLKYTVGETNVVVGGKVNENVDISDHTFGYVLYGGCYSEGGTTKVSGDTHVTVEEGAKFRYIYGGGAKTGTPVPTVDGQTYVTVKDGNIMSVFGGGYKIPCGNTNVKILGGTIEQVFGGSESASASGNTNIELLGGEITRRVYGGCYNDFSTKLTSWGWVTEDCHVAGTTNVTIGPNVNISLNSTSSDRGVFGGSRYKQAFDDEKATVIFLDGCHEDKQGLLGRDSTDSDGRVLGSPNKYDYLVDATAGGTVTSANGKLYVKPYANYTATVTGATADATEGIYVLPNTDSIITVNFTN